MLYVSVGAQLPRQERGSTARRGGKLETLRPSDGMAILSPFGTSRTWWKLSSAGQVARRRSRRAPPFLHGDDCFKWDFFDVVGVHRFGRMDDWRGGVAHVHPGLHFCEGEHGMGGRTAAEPIPAGAELMSIPYAAVIGVDTATARLFPVAPSLRDLLAKQLVTGRTLIYLYILVAERDPAGHGPYLRSLPATHDDPLWWSAEELRALAGTNLEAAVEERRCALRRSYDALFPCLYDRHPGVFEPRAAFSWERFLWAHSSFTSRAFPQWLGRPPPPSRVGVGAGPSEAEADPTQAVGCLLPALDTLNHGYRARITWLRHADRLAFVTEDAVSARSPVLNNYGPKSNEELLLGYGFVLRPNPQDTVTVRFAAPPTPAGSAEEEFSRGAAVAAIARWASFDPHHVLRRSTASVARLEALYGVGGAAVGAEAVASSVHDPCAQVGGALPSDFLPYLRLVSLPDDALRFLWEVMRRWPAAPASPVDAPSVPATHRCLCAMTCFAFVRAVLNRLPLGDSVEAGIAALSAKLQRLLASHPWLAGDGEKDAATGRLAMAREYVRGQRDVLTDALAELRAQPSSQAATAESAVVPAPVRAPAPPVFSLTTLPVVAPALAALLNSVEGLELANPEKTADSASCEDDDDALARMQLALFLLHQRSAGAASPWHDFIAWAARKYDPVALRVRTDALDAAEEDAERTLSLRRGCPVRAALSSAAAVVLRLIASRTREAVAAAAGEEAEEAYAGLFPALSQSAPRVFPRRSCTQQLWAWANLVVDAEGSGKGCLAFPRAAMMGSTDGAGAPEHEPATSGSKRTRAEALGMQRLASGLAAADDMRHPTTAPEALVAILVNAESSLICGADAGRGVAASVASAERHESGGSEGPAISADVQPTLFEAVCFAAQLLCAAEGLSLA